MCIYFQVKTRRKGKFSAAEVMQALDLDDNESDASKSKEGIDILFESQKY